MSRKDQSRIGVDLGARRRKLRAPKFGIFG